MDIIVLAAWVWVLGVVGVAAAVVLHVGLRRGMRAPDRLTALRRGYAAFLRREYLVLAIFVVVAGALLGWATTWLTGLAFLTGAVASVLAGLGGLRAAADGGGRVATAADDAAASPLGPAFDAGSVLALAVSGLVLLGLGLWYSGRGAGAITDVDFEAFAALVAGFALGAACVALCARVMGAVPGGDRALAVLAVPLPDEVAPVTAISLTDATGRLLAGVGGTGADLFGSLACGAVASMALGAGVPQYATSRQQAITLPLLLIAAGLVAALGGVGLARALRRRAGGGPTRIVALAVTALFLVLAYGLVRALGFQIVDPTGLRVFRPTAPFWAVVFGVAAALLIGVANSLAVSRLRRPAEGVPPAERPALAAGAAVAPAVLVALAVWPSYFLGGLYCVGIAALGLTITVAANMALAVLAPILDAAAATGAPESGPNLPATGPARVLAARTAAMGQGMAVASAAVTALAALAAFASLVGLPEGTLDLLDAPVLPGLIIGVAVPFAFIAAIVAAIRRGAVLGAAEAERQLEAIPGLARGRASPDVGAAMSVAARAAARGLIAPALLAIVLPIVAGLVSLTFLGGLVAGAILVAFVLAAALTPAETTLAAAAPTLNSLARVMALVALALSAFLGGLHVVAVPTTSLLEHARPLLALLGG